MKCSVYNVSPSFYSFIVAYVPKKYVSFWYILNLS